MPTAPRPSPWRRLTAYLIDYVLIAVYVGAVTAVFWGLGRGTGIRLGDVDSAAGKQAIIFCVLTLPVVLYFAILESRPNGATVGKRLLHLRVRSVSRSVRDDPARFAQTLIRAAGKFAPWEVAHTAIWRMPTDPDDPAIWPWITFGLVLVVCLVYVGGLFLGSGRTLYDLAAGTRVMSV